MSATFWNRRRRLAQAEKEKTAPSVEVVESKKPAVKSTRKKAGASK